MLENCRFITTVSKSGYVSAPFFLLNFIGNFACIASHKPASRSEGGSTQNCINFSCYLTKRLANPLQGLPYTGYPLDNLAEPRSTGTRINDKTFLKYFKVFSFACTLVLIFVVCLVSVFLCTILSLS